jgi:hypothetical protein
LRDHLGLVDPVQLVIDAADQEVDHLDERDQVDGVERVADQDSLGGSWARTSRPRDRHRAAQLAPITPVPTTATVRT